MVPLDVGHGGYLKNVKRQPRCRQESGASCAGTAPRADWSFDTEARADWACGTEVRADWSFDTEVRHLTCVAQRFQPVKWHMLPACDQRHSASRV